MKAAIEKIPFDNKGIEVTSENEVERKHLLRMWERRAMAIMLSRNPDGSVTLTFGPCAKSVCH